MKHSTFAALAVAALACGGASAAPKSSAVKATAPLPEVVIRANRVTRAVEGYEGAMATHDSSVLPKLFTDDAVVEFVTDTTGSFLAVHADSLLEDAAPSSDLHQPHVTNVRVFPTNDKNAVFVQYDIVADSGDHSDESRLALVEMRGDKIEKMVNFNAPAASLAHSSACVTPSNVAVTRR